MNFIYNAKKLFCQEGWIDKLFHMNVPNVLYLTQYWLFIKNMWQLLEKGCD